MRIRVFSTAAVFGILFCGFSQEVIVHSDAPYAASELQHHLQLITGRRIPVVPEAKYDGKQPAFHVGRTRFAKKSGIDFASFAPEEWCYRSSGKNVILGGHPVNGNEYAVWRFLENELGVRWFTFESTYIPKRKTLSFRGLNRRGKPAFLERQIYPATWRHGLNADAYRKTAETARRNRLNPRKLSPVIRSALPGIAIHFMLMSVRKNISKTIRNISA